MSEPERPPPPIIGKVTHHSVELYWNDALDNLNRNAGKGDGRVRVTVQEEDKHSTWGNVYTGYGKKTVVDSLEAWTQYRYRLRFANVHGNSEWSPSVTVSTTKEPLTGEHLHRAILSEDLNAVDRILDTGDVQVDVPDKYGFSPLMQAAQRGLVNILTSLIEHGADIDFANDAGKTSLMLAAFAGKLVCVKELRHYGAKYSLRDKGGSTPLHWSVHGGNRELIKWMIDDGADVNAKDYSGWNALQRCAAINGKPEVAEVLIRNGVQVNATDNDGKTALMTAVLGGNLALVETLINHNADLTVKTERGKSAYEMAVSMDKRRITKYFEDYIARTGIKI